MEIQMEALEKVVSVSSDENMNGKEPTVSAIDKTLTMDEIQSKTGKSKHLGEWNFFASDRTHLRDTLEYSYILQWILGMFCAIFALFIVEYGIFKLLKIHFCDIDKNTDFSIFSTPFLSTVSISYTFQQFLGLGVCFGAYWMFHSPEIAGVKHEDFLKWRIIIMIIGWGLLCLILFFIIPINYNFNVIITPISMCWSIIFGFIGNGIEGARRLAIWALLPISIIAINYILSALVFSKLRASIFGIIYPFYLTVVETVGFFVISIFDIPKCCRSKNMKINTDNNGSGLGAIYFWRDRDLYVFVCALNVFVESYRVSSLVLLKNDYVALILTFIISIITEICARNNLYYEIIYRVIWRQSAPPLTRVYAIYLGCKLHTEYLPICILILYNLLHFGYTADCYFERRMINMDISDKYWFIVLFFILEFMCDICGHWSNKLFVKVLKIFDKTDEARRVKYVKLKMRDIIFASMYLSWASIQGFILDANSRQLS